jgi:uncharacterized protein
VFANLPTGSRATFGVLGNHDYGRNWSNPDLADEIAEVSRLAGMQVLRNEVGEVDGLQIVGLDDVWAKRFEPKKALARLDLSQAAIALSHNPDTADRPG